MPMETEKLQPTNHNDGSNRPGFPSVVLLGVMWIVGALGRDSLSSAYTQEYSGTPVRTAISGRKTLLLSLSTAIVPLTMMLASSISAIMYLICFFGRSDHFLRSLAFFSYGLSMLTTQMISTIAWVRNFRRRRACDTHEGYIRWFRVFHGGSFLESFRCQTFYRMKSGMLLIFFFLASPVAVAKVASFLQFDKRCRDWMEYTWMIGDIFNVIFFASFCYFLYLRRINLEAKAIATSKYICRNVGNLDNCIKESRELFREYQQLRTLLLPWLRIAVFSSSFGLTVFITWNYGDDGNSTFNATTTAPTPEHSYGVQSICTYTCNEESYMKQTRMFVLYNILEFSRYFMIAASVLIVAKGLDVLYVWESFQTRLLFSYSAGDRNFWECFISFLKKLHPSTTADTLCSFLIPLLGLASGILGGKRF